MKNLLTIFTLLFMIIMVSPYAEAKKFGGGKSFGKQYNTTSTRKQSTNQTSNSRQTQTAEKPKSNKGFMGGMLGGLLAGGLLGSMFGGGLGGLGGGGGLISILILALLGFAVFKVIKLMRGMNLKQATSNEEYATNSYQQPTTEQFREQPSEISYNRINEDQPAIADSETQVNLPPNFDTKACLAAACNHYRSIQQAWDTNDFSKIKEYVTPALIESLKTERNNFNQEQQTNIMYVDAEIVRADYSEELAELSVKFFGKYKENDNIEQNINDTWHLERNLKVANSPWLIVGIQ